VNFEMVGNEDTPPSDCKKIVIRRYDGERIAIPVCDELIIDVGNNKVSSITFNCDSLSVYNVKYYKFVINYYSYVKVLKHFNTKHIDSIFYGFSDSGLERLDCELDLTNVRYTAKAFMGSNLTEIPLMKNYKSCSSNMFEGTKIPYEKLKAWRNLLKLSNG